MKPFTAERIKALGWFEVGKVLFNNSIDIVDIKSYVPQYKYDEYKLLRGGYLFASERYLKDNPKKGKS